LERISDDCSLYALVTQYSAPFARAKEKIHRKKRLDKIFCFIVSFLKVKE
jgi:hypothetical protein